jgi:HEAT repeat protein
VEPLIVAFEEEGWDVRNAAAGALGKIGDTRAVEPLIAALGDQRVRATAESLGYTRERLVCWAAAEALGQIGDARAVEPLIAALGDQAMRGPAAAALHRLSWSPDNGEAGATYCVARREWDKCVEIGGPAVDPLIAALMDQSLRDKYSKQAAARALGRIGDARAVEPLIAVLSSFDNVDFTHTRKLPERSSQSASPPSSP